MPFHRKAMEESSGAKNRKERGTPNSKSSLLFGSPHKKESAGESLKARNLKKKPNYLDRRHTADEVRTRGRTPRAIQGHHKSPMACHRKLKQSPTAHLSFSPPIESAPSPAGRKAAGVYFPSTNGVRIIRDYISNPFCNAKNGPACCMPDTDSQTSSPAGSIHHPSEGPFVAQLDSFRDLAHHLSEVDESTLNSYPQNLDNRRGSLPIGDKRSPSLLSRMRNCKTPDVIRSAKTSTNSRSHSPVPDAEFHSATAAAAATKWSRVTFEYGHLQKRCQYLEAEVEYLRDRESELNDRVGQAQAENAQLKSQIQTLGESYAEALADYQKAHDSYSEQAQSLNRLRTAYNKKAQEVIELKETLERERAELTASLRGVQEELEREKNRFATYKARTARPSVFTDTDTDISLNDFFEDDSRPPSSEFQTGNLSSSLNNSPRLSPRSYDYLRAENKRLLEENKKLREECEELERNRRQCQQRFQLDSLKQDGNRAFQAGRYEEALKCYNAALELGHEDTHLQAILHCNTAAVFLQMERYLEALVSSCHAIKCDTDCLRAYQKRAGAYEAMGDISSALEDLTHVVNSKGSSSVSREAQTHLSDLQRKGKRSRFLDAYKILGLKASATGAAIKAQYRKLALQYHPDKAGDQPGADEAFKLVSQAHTILSDDAKRKRFDASQQRGSRSPTTWT